MVLAQATRVNSELEVSLGYFIQLRYIRRDRSTVAEKPYDSDLVSPLGYTLFESSKQLYGCIRVFLPNTPKHYVNVRQGPDHCLLWKISTNIYQKSRVRSPVLKNSRHCLPHRSPKRHKN